MACDSRARRSGTLHPGRLRGNEGEENILDEANSKISVVFHNLRRKLGTGLFIGRCSRGEVLGIWIRDEECSL